MYTCMLFSKQLYISYFFEFLRAFFSHAAFLNIHAEVAQEQ